MMSEQEFKLQNAQNLMNMGEYEEGIKLLRELGDYPLALKLLGFAYYNGDGVEENHDKALGYFVSAYENGENDFGLYEMIHELICDNLRILKGEKCDFKEEIDQTNKLLKDDLDFIAKTSCPYDESTQLLISMQFALAFNKCCDIIKVFLARQNKNDNLIPHQLFIEGMKLGLTEIEFIKDIIPCHNRINEGVYSVTNDIKVSMSIMAMRGFMERVDEVINNKSDKDIISEILIENSENREEDDDF